MKKAKSSLLNQKLKKTNLWVIISIIAFIDFLFLINYLDNVNMSFSPDQEDEDKRSTVIRKIDGISCGCTVPYLRVIEALKYCNDKYGGFEGVYHDNRCLLYACTSQLSECSIEMRCKKFNSGTWIRGECF